MYLFFVTLEDISNEELGFDRMFRLYEKAGFRLNDARRMCEAVFLSGLTTGIADTAQEWLELAMTFSTPKRQIAFQIAGMLRFIESKTNV